MTTKNMFTLSIFHRVLLMSLCSVLILLFAMLIQLNGVNHMISLVEGQSDLMQQQDTAIQKQQFQLNQQADILNLQKTAQSAFDLYFEYLFWRYNSVITEDGIAIENGNKAEQQLRQKLSAIYDLDEDLGEAADAVAIYLDDFNDKIATAVELAKNNESKQLIIAKVGAAQSDGMAMNAMFETILEQAGGAVTQAGETIKLEGLQVLDATEQVKQSIEAAKVNGSDIKSSAIIILITAVIISIAIGILFSRSITLPIKRLVKVIIDIEQHSDLTKRVRYSKQDEIGAIATAFNAMLDTFHAIVTHLASDTDNLAQSSKNSAKISDRTSTSAQQLHQETDMVATASNQMAVTVKGINDTTSEAVENANIAQQACESGQNSVAQTMHSIEALNQEMNSQAESVTSLAASAEAIGSVLDVIRSIADQTNLLALNAAIEAARAGDQGRGFAVVADEVRTLAKKTSDSTDEIQRMIEALQSLANNAVQQMAQSQAKTQQTAECANSATQSIAQVLNTVEIMNNSNHQISHATQEQTLAAQSIDKSIVSISQLTNDVSAAAEQTREASGELNDMVSRLRTLIGQFKY